MNLPGPVVAMQFSNDNLILFEIYEKPRRWWHRTQHYGVRQFPGSPLGETE